MRILGPWTSRRMFIARAEVGLLLCRAPLMHEFDAHHVSMTFDYEDDISGNILEKRDAASTIRLTYCQGFCDLGHRRGRCGIVLDPTKCGLNAVPRIELPAIPAQHCTSRRHTAGERSDPG